MFQIIGKKIKSFQKLSNKLSTKLEQIYNYSEMQCEQINLLNLNYEAMQKQNDNICQKLIETDSNRIQLEMLLKNFQSLQFIVPKNDVFHAGKNFENQSNNYNTQSAKYNDFDTHNSKSVTDINLKLQNQSKRRHLIREQELMDKISTLNAQVTILQDRLNIETIRPNHMCVDFDYGNNRNTSCERLNKQNDHQLFCFSDYRWKRRQKEYQIRVKKYYN